MLYNNIMTFICGGYQQLSSRVRFVSQKLSPRGMFVSQKLSPRWRFVSSIALA
jgi:hypothetical protein